MKKTILVFLAGMALLLLACSPEVPTVGSTPADTRAPEEPTSASPTVAVAPFPLAASGSTATFPAPTEAPVSNTPSPTPAPTKPTSATTATPAVTTVTTVSPSPQADPGAPVVLALAVAKTPVDLPVYSRDDWRHWIDEDGDCQDTRNEVPAAESLADVTYRADRRCRVDSGQWLAPYSSTAVAVPGDLDIGHMVPLANAHWSGAWQWSSERKRQYANYLDDPNISSQ